MNIDKITFYHLQKIRKQAITVIAVLALLPMPVFSSSTTSAGVADLVIEADWLARNLTNTDIVVVDTRTRSEYQAGHIDGAMNIPVSSTFGSAPNNDLIAPISQIQNVLSNAGIDNETDVVLYDGGEYVNAARVFWVFEVYGHKKVKLLNGGFDTWKRRNYPVSTEMSKRIKKTFIPTIVPNILSTKFSTRLAISDQTKVIIDARSEMEYDGSKSRTDRYGHIPSAINKPFYLNYEREEGVNQLKTVKKLKDIYSDVGQDKKIIAYCNRGRESALTYFILRRLGYNVSAYDGSWLEWSSDKSMPIVSPAQDTN